MKKVFLLAAAAMMITGVSMADTGKKKKGAKNKSDCSKSHKSGKTCGKDKTARL